MLANVAHNRESGEFIRFTVEPGGDEEEAFHGQSQSQSQSVGLDEATSLREEEVARTTLMAESVEPVFSSGYNREREMRAMVSALTRVVSSGSGQRSTEWVQGIRGFPPMMSGFEQLSSPPLSASASASSSSPVLLGSVSGHKRGRQEEEEALYGAIGDLTAPSQGESSSSGAIGTLTSLLCVPICILIDLN